MPYLISCQQTKTGAACRLYSHCMVLRRSVHAVVVRLIHGCLDQGTCRAVCFISIRVPRCRLLIRSSASLDARYTQVLGNDFCFADSFEDIGHTKGDESRMAVVHIDGNSMGERFKRQNDLAGIRKLSQSVGDAVQMAFTNLLQEIVRQWPGYEYEITPKKYGAKTVLPILPIIIGGDDITFVCPGRLGIDFARIFISKLEAIIVSDGDSLAACAGVSVVKAKYPFYRAYSLAEELCSNAKRAARMHGGSWIDFHLTSGGRSKVLGSYVIGITRSAQGNLLKRPYALS